MKLIYPYNDKRPSKSTPNFVVFPSKVRKSLTAKLLYSGWEVYIPYKLCYGTEKAPKSEIPGYSTLIFDIGLAGYYRPKAPTRAGAVSGSWIKK